MKLKELKLRTPLIVLVLFISATIHAQDKTKVIGNKPREGSSNFSFAVTKDHQVGVKMNAGRKPVQLLKLNFGVNNLNKDSLKFRVNVYEFSKDQPGENLAKERIIGVILPGKNRLNINLSSANIITKGTILVAIEFLSTYKGSEPAFSIGLFNGGTYRYEGSEWKKTPVAGVDFNVLVREIK
jgi:uncharacterized membrane protein